VAGLGLSEEQLRVMDAHWDLLLKWNRKMNLTRITGPEEAALRHYGESLFLGHHLSAGRIVDIGSGAGFPGVPVAVLRLDCQVDLVESTQKKAAFLMEAARGLGNVRVLARRGDQVSAEYDWMISRAVDPGEVLRLRLAPRTALLISRDDVSRLPSPEVIPLPWDGNRVLAKCFT
jgi:16S rRNA (guanine527-N7)-methyltransferase